ncbi:uncharacterized protein MONBRDRAFT_37635, partial [Monosiga brevicollis MX1]
MEPPNHEDDEPLGPHLVWADAVTTIELYTNRQEVESGEGDVCYPEYTHQVFGETEKIYGYDNLRVRLLYGAGSLLTSLCIEYGQRVESDETGVEADNVEAAMLEWLPEEEPCLRGVEAFKAAVDQAEAKFTPPGIKQHEYHDHAGNTIEVYLGRPSDPSVHAYHQRAQTFTLWAIEAASYIDLEDDKWHMLYAFMRIPEGDGFRHALVGFVTLYTYYAYPANLRPRI